MKLTFCITIITVLLCCAFYGDGWSSSARAENKKDYSSDLFSGGNGTKDDPFILSSVEELGYLAHQAREAKYKGSFFILDRRSSQFTHFRNARRHAREVSDDCEDTPYTGYNVKSPSRGSGTADDPYVFDSSEQMIYLYKTVQKGMYRLGGKIYYSLETENWLDYAAESYAGGDGTQINPFLIENAEQLALLAKQVREGDSCEGKYYKQTKDIDLGGKQWTPIGGTKEYDKANFKKLPIGGYGYYFSGVFDGNKRRISRLTMTRQVVGSGLFNILESSVVKNVHLEDMKIAMGLHCGGIAVWMDRSKIIDCEVKGSIAFLYRGGGIAGDMRDSEIIGCSADIESYYYLSSLLSFIGNYDAYNINTIRELHDSEAYLSFYRWLRNGSGDNSFSFTRAFSGGITAIAQGENCLIKNCKAKVYFSRYSDFIHIGYYGGVCGEGYTVKIENCEAFDYEGNALSHLGTKYRRYYKGFAENDNN
jgi:hypothetical protein